MSSSDAINRIAVITSGGDAPGMNAAVRAVVLTAENYGIEVVGFRHGYEGVLTNDYIKLSREHVEHILQYSGTIIKSARSERFKTEDGGREAADNLDAHQIDGLCRWYAIW